MSKCRRPRFCMASISGTLKYALVITDGEAHWHEIGKGDKVAERWYSNAHADYRSFADLPASTRKRYVEYKRQPR